MSMLAAVFATEFPDLPGTGGVAHGGSRGAESGVGARDPLPAHDPADRTLVERIRGTHESDARAAFDALYDASYARLARFAMRYVHDADVAHDVVQDAFIALWLGRTTWRAPMGSAPYLYGAVRNQALKRLRHDDVVQRGQATVIATIRPAEQPDATTESAEFEVALSAALAELPERRRSAFLLRAVDGLSYDAIGAILGVSGPAAYKQVMAAITLLRTRLAAFAR